ncbi:RNA-binding protein NOB1 [Phytophthora infestans T30-4]|uniref:RNA-binding protein NOB1 n=1 Tax=Phytophthora infestans (strain T30-4) TaxID=403677 RepID=D0NLM8_PHYIT|nr:RNA-binding protein NOB1 [Phytophthora infestans T30-4]EEY60575.1 RNA-binding protein NOB1 [Phytophthora infestans T30-4]|eukprot:XP_002899948.1 RNA-binding protein NOB1 [Phytophthora infestans T30-4]
MADQRVEATAAVEAATLSPKAAEQPSTPAFSYAAAAAAPAAPEPSKTTKKKVLHLVIDSGAIIKGTNLAVLAENFWTVPDVLDEIRDKKSRAILERLPFTLQTREPSAEAMKAVVNFSRKTGDFTYLSLTDLRVMALSYQLEVEANGADHLRTSPKLSQTVTRAANGKIVGGSQTNIPCKYFGTAMGCKYGDECRFTHDEAAAASAEDGAETPRKKVDIPCRFFNTPEGCKYGDDCSFVHEEKTESEEPTEDEEAEEPVVEQVISEEIRNADVKSRIMGGFAASSNAGAAEDDGKNWITGDNFAKFTASPFGDGKGLEEISSRLPVACITTDFSMQNVMLQIGLRLLSTEGMIIKRVKQWILRCIACFTTSTEMDRMFCPKCGNSTMERVSYSLDRDGHMTFYTRANRPTKLSGTKFSLPKPKGGRNGDLLLREDQLLVGIWGQRQRQHKKVMQSAFGENVAHDLGVKAEKQTGIQVGYGRMNPNAQKGRERRGKKKKRN